MPEARKRLLLISSSVIYGTGYLDHAEQEIRNLLGAAKRVVFIPFALHDREAYAQKVTQRFAAMGYEVEAITLRERATSAVEKAQAIFIGGGNTFRLLKALYDYDLLAPIRDVVNRGIPYIGSSAGANVAAPTLKTTKDMPIVQPPSFDALGLVRFQISPHFQDPDPNSTHMGETQEERILQFLEENDTPVIGLREAAMLRCDDSRIEVRGGKGARVFRKGHAPLEVLPGARLDANLVLQAAA